MIKAKKAWCVIDKDGDLLLYEPIEGYMTRAVFDQKRDANPKHLKRDGHKMVRCTITYEI